MCLSAVTKESAAEIGLEPGTSDSQNPMAYYLATAYLVTVAVTVFLPTYSNGLPSK